MNEVEYALVTSSALPGEIQESEHYISLDREQWLDLVDYSADLVKTDAKQEIVFLIVAKGTTEQQAEDDERRELKHKAYKDLEGHNCSLEDSVKHLHAQISILEKEVDERVDIQAKHDLLQSQLEAILGKKSELKDELDKLREAERLEDEREDQAELAAENRQRSLRNKSISIFNALYEK